MDIAIAGLVRAFATMDTLESLVRSVHLLTLKLVVYAIPNVYVQMTVPMPANVIS